MFTRAAKDLLRNTITSVDHHNRVLEEQEMWRQWELEQGLTMMVSDESIRARCAEATATAEAFGSTPSRKRARSPSSELSSSSTKRSFHWTRELAQAKEKDPQRWGHSGYKELYPEEFCPPASPSSSSSAEQHTKQHSKKRSKKRCHKHRHLCSKHQSKQNQQRESEADVAREFLQEQREHRLRSKVQPGPGSSNGGRRSRSRQRRRHIREASSESDRSDRVHRRSPSSSSTTSSSHSDSELVWEERKT